MVIPRSCSSILVSVNGAYGDVSGNTALKGREEDSNDRTVSCRLCEMRPAAITNESISSVLPWPTCAMTDKFLRRTKGASHERTDRIFRRRFIMARIWSTGKFTFLEGSM